ncbi:Sulfotransferase 2 [Carabus blaptoides fortunei]
MSLIYKPLTGTIREKIDKYFGYKNSLIEVYPNKIYLPEQIEEIGQSILDAPVRKDDIWLLSYPRTGSTWTQEMVWLIGNDFNYEGAKCSIQPVRTPLIELSAILSKDYKSFMNTFGNSVDVVNNLPSPRYIKTHLPLELLPKQLEEVKPKAPYGCVWKNYLPFWNKRNEPNVMFIKYEDMKRDQKKMIRKTAEFLEKSVTDEEVDTLAEYLSFKNMKSNPAVNLERVVETRNDVHFSDELGKTFIRKGEVGDWKNHMTPELSKRFDDWTEENLKDTGLSFD